ncbi:MAG: YcjF family protein [Candidatus Thiodiazotropha sp.]|jgi:uncharacterized protein (DUF697 family)
MTAKTQTVEEEVISSETNQMILRQQQADSIVAKYAAWSSAFGILPIPIADMAGISGTQVGMVASLSRLYGVPFSKRWIRTLLSAILGGVAPLAVTSSVVSSLFKSMPGVGLTVGIAGMAGLSNLATRTIGRLFIDHFERGGDLSNVNTEKMRKNLEQEIKKN